MKRVIKTTVWAVLGLFIVLAFVPNSAHAATKDGQAMFDKLTNLSGIHSVDKRVNIKVKDALGSYTDYSGNIVIARGDIGFCKRDRDCIGFIAAHELGHNVLGHTRGHHPDDKQAEKDADMYAIKLTKLAGLDPCAGADFFKRLIVLYGDAGGTTHPKHSDRVKYMEAACSAPIALPDQPWSSRYRTTY